MELIKNLYNLSLLFLRGIVVLLLYSLAACFLMLFACFKKSKKSMILWGGDPLHQKKYWSRIVKELGIESKTLMKIHYSISEKEDFDLYYDDLIPGLLKRIRFWQADLGAVLSCRYALRNAAVVHFDFRGAFLSDTPIWFLEARLFKLAKVKMVVCSYGSDALMYSRITDPATKHVLLQQYPQAARRERHIEKRVRYWEQNADVIISGMLSYGLSRWDCLPVSLIFFNSDEWQHKEIYSTKNGYDGVVKVSHASNHRVISGTEFLLRAVEELRAEGLSIELILMENITNREVKRLMENESDIHVGQLGTWTYGLSEIEGMACGVPVLSSFCQENSVVLRRYSYLNECPILFTTPETLKENLRILITRPMLREEMGRAGRKYVEKYHSEDTGKYVFGAIYDKILHEKQVDLMNLFNPMISEYNENMKFIRHPLIENKLPSSYVEKNNISS